MKVKLNIHGMSMREIAQACDGTLTYTGNTDKIMVNAICTDSREADVGTLFIALKGEKTDGHKYIGDVLKKGCRFVLCEDFAPSDLTSDCAVIRVCDSLRAIGDIAAAYRKDSYCKRIAITGSVGKTTTKEYVAAVVGQKYKTSKTPGNHNSWLGMPMAMLGEDPECEASVLEMGMSARGEISHLSKTAKPDIALITNIGTAHLEILKTRENICRAKAEIIDGLKEGGLLILCGDEPLLRGLGSKNFSTVYVSLENKDSDYRATNIVSCDGQTVFDLICRDKTVEKIKINLIGNHNVIAAAFAYAVGESLGLCEEEIRRGLLSFHGSEMSMRQNIYRLGDITVVEDCYNASPESMRAASSVLSQLCEADPNSRSVAVLGDMRELGESSKVLHRQVGEYFAKNKTGLLFTFGKNAVDIAKGAIDAGMSENAVFVNDDIEAPTLTADMLKKELRKGDIVLFKASRAVAAERIIELIKNCNQR